MHMPKREALAVARQKSAAFDSTGIPLVARAAIAGMAIAREMISRRGLNTNVPRRDMGIKAGSNPRRHAQRLGRPGVAPRKRPRARFFRLWRESLEHGGIFRRWLSRRPERRGSNQDWFSR